MECICLRDCTVRMDGKSIFFEKDQIVDVDKCPEHHFIRLGTMDINFSTATEEMLLRSKNWKIKDALDFLNKKYNYTKTGPPVTRKEVAKLVVDMRYRKVSLSKE